MHRFPVAIAVTGEVSVTLGYPAGAFVTAEQLAGQLAGYAHLDGSGKLAQGEIPDIDCGEWDGDPVAAHNASPYAHQAMRVDGNNTQGADGSESLAEHMANPAAHQNMMIDGNNG